MSLREARDAAGNARRLSYDHDRVYGANPADAAIAARGGDLRRLVGETTAQLQLVQQTVRAAEAMRRKTEKLADDAGLQARLRAETQARRDAAARTESPPPRRARGPR
jgi:hypothetical protein